MFKTYDGETEIVLVAILNALIRLPAVLLFTAVGLLANKYPKNRVMRTSARAAVGLTRLITLCYYAGWFWTSFGITFLLAVKRVIYPPARNGYIKKMAGKLHLAAANSVVRAVSWDCQANRVLHLAITRRF